MAMIGMGPNITMEIILRGCYLFRPMEQLLWC